MGKVLLSLELQAMAHKFLS